LGELVDPDEQTVGGFVRRLFGLEEPEEADEIDLLWTEERATADIPCIDAPSDTPLLEEGTALDVEVRELLRLTARAAAKAESTADKVDGAPTAPPEVEGPAPRSRPTPVADLFAPIARTHPPPSVDLFDAYGKRSLPPASGTFLAAREDAPRPKETGVKPARAAAAHFDAGWKLLRQGKVTETLAEWETAMQLDPNNRSYTVNVQKLRLKLQR
jgi:hypothetical protein